MSICIEIINSIFEIFIVLFFFKQTLSLKTQKPLVKYSAIIIVSIIHIVRSFAYIPTYINLGITFVLWSIFLILLFDGSHIRKIIMISIYFVIFIICDILTRFITASILNVQYNNFKYNRITTIFRHGYKFIIKFCYDVFCLVIYQSQTSINAT